MYEKNTRYQQKKIKTKKKLIEIQVEQHMEHSVTFF